eukprot:9218318-Pyramimonas_sp.AAC.1
MLEEAPTLAKGKPHGLVGAAAITAVLEEWEELWIPDDRAQEAAPSGWSYPWKLNPISEDQIVK